MACRAEVYIHNLTFRWRRTRELIAHPSVPALGEVHGEAMKKFSASIPRKMFWSRDVGGKSHCPACRSKLESEFHTFMMAVRHAGEVHPFFVGNDAGYFCLQCPTVVLHYEIFVQFARSALDSEYQAQFTVLGLVDLEAIPQEKRSVPFGGDDNPIPLVKFTNIGKGQGTPRSRGGHKKRRKRLKKRKRK